MGLGNGKMKIPPIKGLLKIDEGLLDEKESFGFHSRTNSGSMLFNNELSSKETKIRSANTL